MAAAAITPNRKNQLTPRADPEVGRLRIDAAGAQDRLDQRLARTRGVARGHRQRQQVIAQRARLAGDAVGDLGQAPSNCGGRDSRAWPRRGRAPRPAPCCAPTPRPAGPRRSAGKRWPACWICAARVSAWRAWMALARGMCRIELPVCRTTAPYSRTREPRRGPARCSIVRCTPTIVNDGPAPWLRLPAADAARPARRHRRPASACPCCLSGRLPRQRAQQHVEHRRQEEAEDGHADHAGEHRDAHGVAHLGAGAGREHQRQHAHDEGERGHQDRPQPQPARLDRGLAPACARRTPARARTRRSGSRSSPTGRPARSGRSA